MGASPATSEHPDFRRKSTGEDISMTRRLFAAAAIAVLATFSGCATIAGTMIGTGVGTLAGAPFSGAMIGGGVGMLVDFR